VKSFWKPWSYLAGADVDEEGGSPAPPSVAPEREQTARPLEEKITNGESPTPTPRTASPGESDGDSRDSQRGDQALQSQSLVIALLETRFYKKSF